MQADIAKLILRVSVGVMMLFHGVAKIISGVGGVKSMLASSNIPQFFAYGVFLVEIVAPILLILGLKTKISAWFMSVGVCFIVYVAHGKALFSITKYGGLSAELLFFYIFTCIAIALLGAGKYSVDRS